MRFGDSFLYHEPLSKKGKLGFKLHGYPFIGGFLRSLYFKKHIDTSKLTTVLDAGCGAGEYSFFVASKNQDTKVKGIDLDYVTINKNKHIASQIGLNNLEFSIMDLQMLNDRDKYDLIICSDVLEHIENNNVIIHKFFEALSRDGVLFIHLPVSNWNRNNLLLKCYEKHEQFEEIEHIGKHYEANELHTLLKETGFSKVKTGYSFGVFGKLAWEIDQIVRTTKYMKTVLLPLLKCFCYLDLLLTRKGAGVWAFARK